eukprot:g1908.t1
MLGALFGDVSNNHGTSDEPYYFPLNLSKACSQSVTFVCPETISNKFRIRTTGDLTIVKDTDEESDTESVTQNSGAEEEKSTTIKNVLPSKLEICVAPGSVLHGTDDLQAHMVWESSIVLSNWLLTRRLDVRGKSVLELGSGTALPSIIASLFGGAKEVCCTDYPDETIVKTMVKNVESSLKGYPVIRRKVRVRGYKWGDDCAHHLIYPQFGHENNTSKKVVIKAEKVDTEKVDTKDTSDNIKDSLDTASEISDGCNGISGITNEISDGSNENSGATSETSCHFDILLMSDLLWLADGHIDLLDTCAQCLGPESIAVVTFQNHVDNAPSFFEHAKAAPYHFAVQPLAKVGWGGKAVDEFDSEDEEAYGPVNVWLLSKQ